MSQTDQVAAVVRELLRDAVIGIYLHGSATMGGLKPTSDIDILVLTNRRTTLDERRRLIEQLMPISGPGDPTGRSRSVGLEIVVQSDVRPWRYPGRLDVPYGDWWRSEFARGEYEPWDPSNPVAAASPDAGPPRNNA